jgi:YjbR
VTHHDFRPVALALSDAVEGAHMGHPDFRVQSRIFASIHTDPSHGMVKLTPEQQQAFVGDFPKVFAPESGAWGRGGSTRVIFSEADEELVGEVMTLAWQNVINEHAARHAKEGSTPKRRQAARLAQRSRKRPKL